MKKFLMIILILMFTIPAFAPVRNVLYIEYSLAINTYEALIRAVVYVESRGNNNALNRLEMALGSFQIRKCRIDEYNKRTGKNYSHEEMYDYDKAKEVFMFYCKGRDYETIARCWAGGESSTKRATDEYWGKIKRLL